ncbi:cytochrome bd-I ubiquinol oxidase subunit 2 apoprotein [Mariniphaga anaerophila]|uniref:Cytochrome bd-I ubiquinol oxidase subunit 2 apoprotein n=1 Tax=Mariniphaga anaerophila TaxID=1484053 RepID=A0A1M5FYG9_9BACT|nr:cytochrome d ubiquinol oxidase subunit II [Mariniphaga anaerophila]SHF96232.1 cytochrome bd-I ubiquinol oxidase subunit 2 apoprotein [Mariniphaga anaerophila]
MTEMIFAILAICLLLYVLLGGADFGGGILELLTRGKASGIVTRAIAPVWEANHMWLILVVVILFVGFPTVYTTVLTALHIPVLLVLIGIILRGSAFTFRHYDIDEATPKAVYSNIFRYSSLFTTFFLGVTLGGIILGEISVDYSKGFFAVYIHPWLNLFSFSLGFFMVVLFAFLANIYTVGEIKEEPHITRFTKLAKTLIFVLVLSGALVFAAAEVNGHSLFYEFYHSPASIASVVLASIALPFLWINLNRNNKTRVRIIGAFQTTMIITGWFAIQFPVVVKIKDGADLTVQNSSAPDETQLYLLIALVVGVIIVFPAMGYLYRTFKFNDEVSTGS